MTPYAPLYALHLLAAVVYFVICFTVSQLVRGYQRRLKTAA